MRISWILSKSGLTQGQGNFASHIASYRYRALNQVRELSNRGHTCQLYALAAGEAARDHPALRQSDVIVFAKNHSEPHEVVALLDEAREREIATVADVCDDYFAPGDNWQPYYAALVSKATLVTASSAHLASVVEQTTGAAVCVVGDAYEGPSGSIRFAPEASELKALWFGGQWNLASLLSELAHLPRRIENYQVNLLVLTREPPGLIRAFEQMNARNGSKLRLAFQEWSLERNWTELQKCDLALITVDLQNRFFMAKGANRLIETLRAGRLPVVHPLPAYQEFEKWAWVGDDLAAGMAWALAHPREVRERIEAGQAYVERHYSPQAIALQWENALSRARDTNLSRS